MGFLLAFVPREEMLKMGMSWGTWILLHEKSGKTLEIRLRELQANETVDIDLEEDYGYTIWSSDGYNGWYSGALGRPDGEWSPFD